MATIQIKNFGPIEENSDIEGKRITNGCFVIDFTSVNVFIGHQASGKSTIAKLYSIFTWLEKALVRRQLSNINVEIFERCCVQQEIIEYFKDDSFISYIGDAYSFTYQNNSFTSENKQLNFYTLPKIQYISAARNLLTILYAISSENIIDNKGNILELSSNIPFMVRDLNTEYLKALSALAKNGFSLPIEETEVYYKNHNTFIKTKGRKISMSASSSGIQSITPLLVVSKYLTQENQKKLSKKLQTISTNLKTLIENELSKKAEGNLVENFGLYYQFGEDANLNEDNVLQLEDALKKYVPTRFINIVEEPEQNLFPEAQADVIYELLECVNATKGNQLVISTHSPYILTALNNAIFAREVFDKKGKHIDNLLENKMVSIKDVSAYKFENGKITSIVDKEIGLIDAEQIDSCSTKINDVFNSLLDIRDEKN